MNTFRITIFAVAIFTLSACHKKLFGVVNGSGNNVVEYRTVGTFTEIDLDIDADVIYVQDSVTSVEVNAQANIADVLTTSVRDGELHIEYSARVRSHNAITITIHAPNVKKLDLNGSGNISVPGVLSGNELDLEVSGSGKINVSEIDALELDAEISGSGSILVSAGVADSEEVKISGSGNVDLLGVQLHFADGDVSGSGDITFSVQQHLNARISGSGDIRYSGEPTVDVHVSGSGSVIHL